MSISKEALEAMESAPMPYTPPEIPSIAEFEKIEAESKKKMDSEENNG